LAGHDIEHQEGLVRTGSIAELGTTAATIAALAARITDSNTVDPSIPFALVGLDSVGTIELAAAVEEAFDVELPADVAITCRDANALAATVDAVRSGERRTDGDRAERTAMRADAILPLDVVPFAMRTGRECGLTEARTILLTGATGFLGRWLANELITTSQATLICLVRPGPRDAAARIREALLATGLDPGTIANRVEVVHGDLAESHLGLPRSAVEDLASRVDAVCHAGADVNWVLPYEALKAANVGGTLELLRLASTRGIPFHLVSSLSVYYDVPLGYAQTKDVAEALVQEAGLRGLPVAIYRPSLISGHSETGAFNADDILARVVAGCVRMGTAPDLDWALDCVPVDVTARAIVAQSSGRGVCHLCHPRPRAWRECVLWMRLYGYDVRLVSYHAWLAQLERETGPAGDRSHPLRPLRSFFLARPMDAHGQTLPELMLRSARDHESTLPEGAYPPLDAALLQRYFDAFVASGDLPPPPISQAATRSSSAPLDTRFFTRVLGTHVDRVETQGPLSDHSIIGELTTWRSGSPTGLFAYRLHMRETTDTRDVVVKVKAPDRDAIAVGEALAQLCGDAIGPAYARSAHRLGLTGSHERELAIYEQRDPRFVAHVPAVLATVRDLEAETWTIVLERITNALLQDAVNDSLAWTDASIDCVIRGLASLQAIWYGRERVLRRVPWMSDETSTVELCDMSDLWSALAAHAAPRFSAWSHPTMAAIHRQLVARLPEWRRPLEHAPGTLIHNDFNPRNLCLGRDRATGRPRLIAYDWELAAIGAPQRDLAEFLCFVLPSDASDGTIDRWIARHRTLLERETATRINGPDWTQGFRASLYDLMVTRLPIYALIHRIRPQAFLPRIVRTWYRLYQRFPLEPRASGTR
jgi:thioester reductase-like protein